MTDFLNFLNAAELETLLQTPGISQTLAENLIAARPFETIEDCLQVKGMGKALLAKLKASAEAQADESVSRALIPVAEEALYVPEEEETPPNPKSNAEDQPSFWSRLGSAFANFLRALIRLIFVGALIFGVGAALYYGLPYINQTFIAPVEKNTAQINQLADEITALQTQISAGDQRVTALGASIQAQTNALERLTVVQIALETKLKENNDQALLEIKNQVALSRALDMLGRARLYLAQSNFGLAREDVQSARDVLFALANETNDEVLKQAVARLDLALGNLPQFPVVASGDLEIAWQILTTGAKVNEEVYPTPSPELTLTTTPTPLAETATPTPFDVPSVTPTP